MYGRKAWRAAGSTRRNRDKSPGVRGSIRSCGAPNCARVANRIFEISLAEHRRRIYPRRPSSPNILRTFSAAEALLLTGELKSRMFTERCGREPLPCKVSRSPEFHPGESEPASESLADAPPPNHSPCVEFRGRAAPLCLIRAPAAVYRAAM